MRISMIGQAYEIAMDRASFRWEDAAAGSKHGPGTDYQIDLQGKADRNWRKTFYLVQWDYFGHFKYHLREDGKAISFHRKSEEELELEESLVKALEVLLKIVNTSASRTPAEFLRTQGQFQGAALAV
jgi:hypothetical protein